MGKEAKRKRRKRRTNKREEPGERRKSKKGIWISEISEKWLTERDRRIKS